MTVSLSLLRRQPSHRLYAWANAARLRAERHHRRSYGYESELDRARMLERLGDLAFQRELERGAK